MLSPAQVSQGVWGGKAPGNWEFCWWEPSLSPTAVKVSLQISFNRTWSLSLVESSSKSSFLPGYFRKNKVLCELSLILARYKTFPRETHRFSH